MYAYDCKKIKIHSECAIIECTNKKRRKVSFRNAYIKREGDYIGVAICQSHYKELLQKKQERVSIPTRIVVPMTKSQNSQKLLESKAVFSLKVREVACQIAKLNKGSITHEHRHQD